MQNIRNFCIIAHIDHGKSTLADRFLELTNTVEKRKMRSQLLDQMELERERGITIKLQPVRMEYKNCILNLIDTPGHVDFSYEVSRSLAAVEGAILLVDATQGIQAQTLANYHLALEQNLKIIPVLNKIDLPNAKPDEVALEIADLLNISPDEILRVSAKTGEGVERLLDKIIETVPAPEIKKENSVQALIFDSIYDDYRGVVAYVRVFHGEIKADDKMYFIGTKKESELTGVGFFKPNLVKTNKLSAGEIGYLITGFKNLSSCRVGDTVIKVKDEKQKNKLVLKGYQASKPFVFAGIFCKSGYEPEDLREAIEKIKLTDASLYFEPENSPVLGPGFRCGFLGLLHLEIIQERLKREYNLGLVVTVPSVAYKIKNKTGQIKTIYSPQELPNQAEIEEIQEPWVKIEVLVPQKYIGGLMKMIIEKRGVYLNTEHLLGDRIILHYEMPLTAILTNFYDQLKSISSGYASLSYEIIDYRPCEVEKMNILIAEEPVDSLALIVYKDEVQHIGRKIVKSLKELIPRQMFEIKIQAVLNYTSTGKNKGGKIIASERISAMRKDVTAKLYGGDVTRKRKLLEKQKRGKKKMMGLGKGKVDIPTEAYLSVLKR